MTGSRWTSAICDQPPNAPGPYHWAIGLVISGAALFVSLYLIADKTIPIETTDEAQVEEIVISLGAPARVRPPSLKCMTRGDYRYGPTYGWKTCR